ncbi:hypothetical protein [Shimia sp.]|uniref:hypothetical protein n=1 Tax=Shimia sp. TaxID=1954381 RepID=UPI0035697908
MICHFSERAVDKGGRDCKNCEARFGCLVAEESGGPVWMGFRATVWSVLLAASILLLVMRDDWAIRAAALLLALIGLAMLGRLLLQLIRRPRWWRRTI